MSIATAREGLKKAAVDAKSVMADDSLTVAEKGVKIDAIHADAKAFSDEISLHEKANRLVDGGDAGTEAKSIDEGKVAFKTLGEQIVGSEAFAAVKSAREASGRVNASVEIGTKVANTIGEGTAISNGFLNGQGGPAIIPNYLPGIVDIRFAPLAIGDLFAQGSTESPIVSYVKESAETVGAAATAEAALKPQGDFTLVRVNEQVGKVTVVAKLTDEMIKDFAQASSFLQNRLIGQVAREEDNETLNGTGYPALSGVLGRSGLQSAITVSSGTLADPSLVMDAIYQQIIAIQFNAFVYPDAIVMNPADWQHLRLAKDANKQYYGGGPFTAAYGNQPYTNVDSLWGLRVVTSPRIASGTVLVGSFQECGQLFRRQGITVEMTNSNEDDFKHNLVAVRAESRSALAIYRPGGFGTVAVTWA